MCSGGLGNLDAYFASIVRQPDTQGILLPFVGVIIAQPVAQTRQLDSRSQVHSKTGTGLFTTTGGARYIVGLILLVTSIPN